MLFLLVDMSNIKKFFSKLKSEVKFAKAGEGHRLNEPSAPPPRISQPQAVARQSSDGGAAARAAAIAAQQRLQQQGSYQQSGTSSEN
jgi:UBX domain-containing protein 6